MSKHQAPVCIQDQGLFASIHTQDIVLECLSCHPLQPSEILMSCGQDLDLHKQDCIVITGHVLHYSRLLRLTRWQCCWCSTNHMLTLCLPIYTFPQERALCTDCTKQAVPWHVSSQALLACVCQHEDNLQPTLLKQLPSAVPHTPAIGQECCASHLLLLWRISSVISSQTHDSPHLPCRITFSLQCHSKWAISSSRYWHSHIWRGQSTSILIKLVFCLGW